jgi:hypothetical protein
VETEEGGMIEASDFMNTVDAATKACQKLGAAFEAAAPICKEITDIWHGVDRDLRALAKYRAQVRLKLRGKNWRAAK